MIGKFSRKNTGKVYSSQISVVFVPSEIIQIQYLNRPERRFMVLFKSSKIFARDNWRYNWLVFLYDITKNIQKKIVLLLSILIEYFVV